MDRPEGLESFRNSADGVFVVDASQRIILWNKAAEQIMKYTEAEVLNHNCYRIIAGRIHPEKLWCRAHCQVQSCLARGDLIENFDLLSSTNEGEPIWLNFTILAPVNGDGRFAVHILRDVTKVKKTGVALDQFLHALGVRSLPREKLQDDGIAARPSAAGALPSDGISTLSAREVEVLKLLAEGLSTRSLAQRLSISQFTARNHIQNILVKLDLHSKAQAVSYAFKKGII